MRDKALKIIKTINEKEKQALRIKELEKEIIKLLNPAMDLEHYISNTKKHAEQVHKDLDPLIISKEFELLFVGEKRQLIKLVVVLGDLGYRIEKALNKLKKLNNKKEVAIKKVGAI